MLLLASLALCKVSHVTYLIMNSPEQYNTVFLKYLNLLQSAVFVFHYPSLNTWLCLGSQINAHIQLPYTASKFHALSPAKQNISLPWFI